MKPCERLRSPGFTLLEVLAAVAVLGLVYVVVARGAIQGMQTQGDASRRLRASLLADRTLNELELALAAGATPEIGETQSSQEDFEVVVEVAPFDVASLLEALTVEEDRPETSTASLRLLEPSVRGGAPTVLSIVVRVAWIEGVSEREITRTSFAFDAEAAAPLLETISGPEDQGPEDTGGGS
jgi:prepilin-type N-terminal cleavage/methylation domain-containing protein